MDERTCSIEGCDRAVECRGWCGSHYQRWRRNGDPTATPPRRRRPRVVDVALCSVEHCSGVVKARGWCRKHYGRFQRTGSPTGLLRPPRTGTSVAERGKGPCSIEGCEKIAQTRGWCPMHYQRWRHNGDPLVIKAYSERKPRPKVNRVAPCVIEGCDAVQVGRGLCSLHWHRWKRLGNPLGRLRGEVVDGRRVCPCCRVDRPLAEFGANANTGGRCLQCSAQAAAEYRRLHPDVMWQNAIRYRARKMAALVETFARVEIFERDDWTCGICAEPIDPAILYPDPLSPSIDHVIPLARGGTHERANVQASHFRCNLRKSDKLMAPAG